MSEPVAGPGDIVSGMEIYADFTANAVIIRCVDAAEKPLFEIMLSADNAREMAYNLTRASLAVEDRT